MVIADTVNGFGFHPTLPLGVTSSGHRRIGLEFEDEEQRNNFDSSGKGGELDCYLFQNFCNFLNSNCIFWWCHEKLFHSTKEKLRCATLWHSYVQTVENASERKTYSSVGLSGGVFAVQENCASVWEFSCTWQSSTIVAANSNNSLVNQSEIQQDLIEQTTEFRTPEEGKTDVHADALEVVAEQSITSVELEQVTHNVTWFIACLCKFFSA